MKNHLVASLVLISLLAAYSAPSLAQDAPTRAPEAVTLLTQCAATMGSANALDTYAEGSVTRADVREAASAIIVRSKGSDQERTDRAAQDRQETYVVSRGSGHESRDGVRKNQPAHATRYHRPEHVPALACTLDLARPNMQAFYEGLEQDGAQTLHHIRFVATPRSERTRWADEVMSEFHVYLDAQSLLVRKTRSFVFAPDAIENQSTWEVRYSDYRPVGGVLMPFRIERFDNGQKLDEMVFTNVRVNVGIADSEFE